MGRIHQRRGGITVGRDNHAKVHEATKPYLVVAHDRHDVGPFHLAVGTIVSLVGAKAGLDIGLFLGRQPLGLLGEAGEGEEEEEAKGNRDETLDDEDPAPATIAANTIHCRVLVVVQSRDRRGDLLFPMAEARRPPKAPASEVDEKKKEYRFWASERLYHILIR